MSDLSSRIAHAKSQRDKWAAEVRSLEEEAASDQCLYLHDQWDGPYRMSARCTQPAGHSDSPWKWDHGPWAGVRDEERQELVRLRQDARSRAKESTTDE